MKFVHIGAAFALSASMAAPVMAADLTFTGDLNLLSDLASFEFVSTGDGATLWTDSAATGVDPILTLFKREGADWVFIDQSDDLVSGGNFASDFGPKKATQVDTDGLMIFTALPAARYRLYVSAYDNYSFAEPATLGNPSLSAGWTYEGPNSPPVVGPTSYRVHLDNVNPVPEPATWGLMLAGLAGVGFLRRRA